MSEMTARKRRDLRTATIPRQIYICRMMVGGRETSRRLLGEIFRQRSVGREFLVIARLIAELERADVLFSPSEVQLGRYGRTQRR